MQNVVYIAIGLVAILLLAPVFCSSGRQEIRATSLQGAYFSARKVKNYIADDEKRLQFQLAFGTLQQILEERYGKEKGQVEFVRLVNRKNADQIIALAKKYLEEEIEKGNPKYAQYRSWEDFFAKVTEGTPRVSKEQLYDRPQRFRE